MSHNFTQLTPKAIHLLKQLIVTPSLSREEDLTATRIFNFLKAEGASPQRKFNNVWASSIISEELPTILLNSHHDTVKPSSSWTLDPFQPLEKDGKLYGLGSNDAGGPLVSLIASFLALKDDPNRPYNLILAATAEEEVSGKNGIESILSELGKLDLAIVGEPTQMQMAVAEKGLMVLDCKASGVSGHAARNEGINAIYKAIPDIEWFRSFEFDLKSELLGSVKMSVTQINAGSQHNVVPDVCTYVVDVRTNECYRNEEALQVIKKHVKNSEVVARSTRINSSFMPMEHPLVQKGLALGLTYYGSPTTSDQALIPCISIKIGPGDSARSHTADEFIYIKEIERGIEIYIMLLSGLKI
jgi:acetylornithine deacetylase